MIRRWWGKWKDRRPPKVALGETIRVMHGNQFVGIMVLTEFQSGLYGKEARFVDLASYTRSRQVHNG